MAKRLIGLAVAVAAVLTLSVGVSTAGSTPTLAQFRALDRQVDRLQSQVTTIKADVRDLLVDVFGCTFPGDPLVSFSDGSQAYVLYYDVFCTSVATPSAPGRQIVARAGR